MSAEISKDTLTEETRQVASLLSLVSGWAESVRARAGIMVELAIAEARLAVASAALIVFFGILAAAFVLGAWGMGVAGLAIALLQAGLPAWMVFAGLALAHVAAAWVSARLAGRLLRQVDFSATRKQLEGPIASASSDL